MTRLGYSAVLLALTIAAGCAATAEDVGASADSVHLGTPPDAAAEAGSSDDAAIADAGPTDDGSAPETDGGPEHAPTATTFGAKLTAIGLDPANLPLLHDLTSSQKMKVMRMFNEAMGVQCTTCHTPGDYAAPTKRKEIAAAGWDVIARGVTTGDGSPIFCDSCHHGVFKILDEHMTHDEIGQFMQRNFVNTLRAKSGEAMKCTTCHVNGPPAETNTNEY